MPEHVEFGRYVLERRLAAGGMAEVMLGHMKGPEGFQKRVVVKRILKERAAEEGFVRMFLDEARLVARFNHPNLIHVYELAQEDGQYGLVMEYVEGIDLATVIVENLKRGTVVGYDVAALMIAEAAEGLYYAHELKDDDASPLRIVHRDISPSNLIATRVGVTKIVDFGIAKHTDSSQRTQTGILKGKVGYMSPEQVAGRPVDGRSDIFSLGVVLWELLALQRCFKRETPMETARAVLDADVRPLSAYRHDVPKQLEVALAKMLHPMFEDRHANALEVAQDLRRFLAAVGAPGREQMRAMIAELTGDGPSVPSYSSAEVPVGPDLTNPTIVLGVSDVSALSRSEERENKDTVVQDWSILLDPGTVIGPTPEDESNPSGELPEDLDDVITEPNPCVDVRDLESDEHTIDLGAPNTVASGTSDVPALERTVTVANYGGADGIDGDLEIAPTDPVASPWNEPSTSTKIPVGPAQTKVTHDFSNASMAATAIAKPSSNQRPPPPRGLLIAGAIAGLLLLLGILALVVGERAKSVSTSHVVEIPLEPPPSTPAVEPVAVPPGRETDSPGSSSTLEDPSSKRSRAAPAGRRYRKGISPGLIRFTSSPNSVIFLEGRNLGKTPLDKLEVPPGKHTFVLRGPQDEFNRKVRVLVESGKLIEKHVVFGKGTVNVRALPWADVYVGAQKITTTPTAPINMWEGSHQLRLVNPQLNVERRVRIRVRPGETVNVVENLR